MKYYSTEKKSNPVSFRDALIKGLAPDRGLYLPDSFPILKKNVLGFKDFNSLSFEVMKLLVDGEIPDDKLFEIVSDSFNFDVPLKNIHDNIYVLELFHGPTAAFKDFGARFMARAMSYFLEKNEQQIEILVATSGDTGSAVAKGFYNVKNIHVTILYPKGKVSFLQEQQLTTLGGNITALEVDGTFDDCQHLVKEAFMDHELNSKLNLSSANSINIGRLYPQSLYYFWAYNRVVKQHGESVIFCTPSGNFGNLTGGIIAGEMGLPIKKFIAATNINDTVPHYINTSVYSPKPSKQTYSNAMDVGNPSNFARMLEIYKTHEVISSRIKGYIVDDKTTLEVIRDVYDKYNYILDPHGAVAYKAVSDYIKETGDEKSPIIFLETAHPAKFGDVMKKAVDCKINTPDCLNEALQKDKVSIKMSNDYIEFKNYLLK